MPIAPTLQKYLASKNIEYDVIAHQPTMSSTRTAEACHISGDRLAKAVVLHDGNGYVLAVVPASHHLRLSELSTQLGTKLDLASEREIEQLFADCAQGDSIEEQAEVYLEGGDHATLVRMTHSQFARLTAAARHGRFSVHT